MEYLYVVAGMALGTTLVVAGVLSAAIYTPQGYSMLDSAVTALTGSVLQVGNLLVVTATTAVAFDVLSSVYEMQFSLLVPAIVGYTLLHLLVYRSSIAVTALQGTPFDPDTTFSRKRLRALAPSLPRPRGRNREA